MALKQIVKTETGVEGNYIRIDEIILNKLEKFINLRVGVYFNSDYTTHPLQNYFYSINSEGFDSIYSDGKIAENIYVWLKTNIYTSATDC